MVDEAAVTRGRTQRETAPRDGLAELVASPRSATEILVEQNRERLPDLVGLRFARMLTDPFSFYRGAAAVMAADLAASPSSGIEVMCGGDAHLANFGTYPAPQRSVLVDLNDFDEAAMAPAEWDLKRLVASAIVAARHAGHPDKTIRTIASEAIQRYRAGLAEMLEMNVLDRYHLRLEPHQSPAELAESLGPAAAPATPAQQLARLTEPGPDGQPQFRDDPPIVEHLDRSDHADLIDAFEGYRTRLPADVATLLSQFAVSDLARRVVGVGSVGTRCYLLLLIATDATPLILQIKQAGRSVIDQYGHRRQSDALTATEQTLGYGTRVVAGQRTLQGMPDVFLGALRSSRHDYYLRHYQRAKASIDGASVSPTMLGHYAGACASALARAHAQSPPRRDAGRLHRQGGHVQHGDSRLVLRLCRQNTRRLSPTQGRGESRRDRRRRRPPALTTRWTSRAAMEVRVAGRSPGRMQVRTAIRQAGKRSPQVCVRA